MVNDENTAENKDKLHEFYIGERTALTIENVAKTTLMTWDDWHKFDQEQQEKGNLSETFFMPEEITDNHNRKLTLFCMAYENEKRVFYYKCIY